MVKGGIVFFFFFPRGIRALVDDVWEDSVYLLVNLGSVALHFLDDGGEFAEEPLVGIQSD